MIARAAAILVHFLRHILALCAKPLGIAWLGLIFFVCGGAWWLTFLSREYPHYGGRSYAIIYHPDPVEIALDDMVSEEPPHEGDLSTNNSTDQESVPPVDENNSQHRSGSEHSSENLVPEDLQSSHAASSEADVVHQSLDHTTLKNLKAPLDPTLLCKTSWGFLPVTGPSQKTSWQAYSCPVSDRHLPKISLVVQVMGPDPKTVLEYLPQLPPEINLSFLPYTFDLNLVIDHVRCCHHEVLLSLPMEPLNLDHQDSGPYTLLTGVSAAKNRQNLYWSLGQGVGYVGVMPYLGQRFLSSKADLKPIMDELHARGLLFFDPRSIVTSRADDIALGLSMPYVMNHVHIDQDLIPEKINNALHLLEKIAQKNGYAVGMLFSYPLSLDQVIAWAQTLNGKGYQLVPLSTIASMNPALQPAA